MRAYKDMIDSAPGMHIGPEVIECTIWRISYFGGIKGIVQQFGTFEDRIIRAVLVDVKVAGQNYREFVAHFSDLIQDQSGTVFSGFNTHMVHMQVKEEEFHAR